MKKLNCPTCGVSFTAADLLVADGAGGFQALGKHARPSRAADVNEVRQRHLSPIVYHCPGDRHDELPDGFADGAPTYIVGLFGPTLSSKSQMLLAVVEALVNSDRFAWYGYNFRLNPRSVERYRQIYKDPGDQGKPIAFNTADETYGIAVTVTRTDPRDRLRRRSKSVNLVLCDSSGEAQRNRTGLAYSSSYVYTADMVMMLVPPEAVPEFVDDDLGPMPAGDTAASRPLARRKSQHEMKDVADWVTEALAERQAARDARRIAKPELCVILAKSDLITDRPDMPFELRAEPSYGGPLPDDDRDIDEVWAQLCDRIEDDSRILEYAADSWRVHAPLAATDRGVYALRTYHLAAATGTSPNENGLYMNYRPSRVLDPIVRVLDILSHRELRF